MARALLNNPRLLFLDEPTSGLDPQDAVLFRRIIEDERKKGTTIGVLQNGNGIKALLSGGELQINTVIGNTLPQLYDERENIASLKVTVIPAVDNSDALKSLLIVITMVTAMFMGCTFNAMNIIGEKEDGISLINKVLPITRRAYVIQKIFLGFNGGILSTPLTVCACMKTAVSPIIPLFLLSVLSSFAAALAGLFIGLLSNELMAGIVYIKIVMILFYLVVPTGSMLFAASYMFP